MGMYDNKRHICALDNKLSFLVTLSSVFLLKAIMLSCSKIVFQSANDNTELTRSGMFTFACVCVHSYEWMQPFGQDLTWVLYLLKDVTVRQNNAGGKCNQLCAVLFPPSFYLSKEDR